jgi:hypothetical protein
MSHLGALNECNYSSLRAHRNIFLPTFIVFSLIILFCVWMYNWPPPRTPAPHTVAGMSNSQNFTASGSV